MVHLPRKLGSRCWAPRALGNVPWHPFERKKHEFTEHWSTFHTERVQMPSGLARGGRLRLRRRWDSEALAGPAPRPTQAAGPRGPGVLTRQGGTATGSWRARGGRPSARSQLRHLRPAGWPDPAHHRSASSAAAQRPLANELPLLIMLPPVDAQTKCRG